MTVNTAMQPSRFCSGDLGNTSDPNRIQLRVSRRYPAAETSHSVLSQSIRLWSHPARGIAGDGDDEEAARGHGRSFCGPTVRPAASLLERSATGRTAASGPGPRRIAMPSLSSVATQIVLTSPELASGVRLTSFGQGEARAEMLLYAQRSWTGSSRNGFERAACGRTACTRSWDIRFAESPLSSIGKVCNVKGTGRRPRSCAHRPRGRRGPVRACLMRGASSQRGV